MALSLAGCTTGHQLADFQAGDVRLAVELPAVCDAFLQPVSPPAVTPRTDARVAFVKAAGALDEANTRIIDAASCHRDERVSYKANGKGKPK